MAATSDPVIELAKLINSTPEFTRRINDFTKARDDAEHAKADADHAKGLADQAQRDLDRKLSEHRRDMLEATKVHTDAAAEAARRIELANALDEKNRAAEAALLKRENDLHEREGVVEGLKDSFRRALAALGNL
jgi:hypothetical protein